MPEIETIFQIVPSVVWPYSTNVKLRWLDIENVGQVLTLQIIGPLGGKKGYITVNSTKLHGALHQMLEDRAAARRQKEEN